MTAVAYPCGCSWTADEPAGLSTIELSIEGINRRSRAAQGAGASEGIDIHPHRVGRYGGRGRGLGGELVPEVDVLVASHKLFVDAFNAVEREVPQQVVDRSR